MNRPASPIDPGPSSSASRYEMLATIASGGMGTVYVGRMRGMGGFSRMVAVKRAHPHLLADPTYRAMLVDEARVAARLHHPNVVAVLDVEELEGELSLVMDYVEGTSLYDLVDTSHAAGRSLPPRIAVRIALDACAGLQAAHTLTDEFGEPLGLVHRDVSPQNILVGVDGVARITDFGVAKHAEGAATTTGVLKGKLSYMAPEYLENTRLDARSDVFSLGVVVWEALAGRKLFRGKSELETFKNVLATVVPPLSSVAPWANERIDAILFAALARAPEQRFQSAEDFAIALETEARHEDLIATPSEVGALVRQLVGAALDERRAEVRRRGGGSKVERAPVSAPSLAHQQAPTLVARPPASSPDAEVSGLQRRSQPSLAGAPPSSPRSGPRSGLLIVDEAPGNPEPSRPSGTDPGRAVPMGGDPPNPPLRAVPMGGDPPNPPLRAVPMGGDTAVSMGGDTAVPMRADLPSPVPPDFRSSRGAVWKGAIVLGALAVLGVVIALMTTRSGDVARTPSAPSSTAGAREATAPSPAPQPPANAAAPTANATSISASELPDARPAPFGSARGRMPGKGHTPAPTSAPVSTGIPLSAWPPATPPPPDLPATPAATAAPAAPATAAPAPTIPGVLQPDF